VNAKYRGSEILPRANTAQREIGAVFCCSYWLSNCCATTRSNFGESPRKATFRLSKNLGRGGGGEGQKFDLFAEKPDILYQKVISQLSKFKPIFWYSFIETVKARERKRERERERERERL
jgi:hypothetical protein